MNNLELQETEGRSALYKETNLFFATRPGQIRNIVSYIAQRGCERNRLVVLTTVNEGSLRPLLDDAIPKEQFDKIVWPILPSGPAKRAGMLRRSRLFDVIKEAIIEILDGDDQTRMRVHLFHPSAYYIYVPRILARMHIEPISMVLLEEGLSTYKWCALPYEIDTYGRDARSRGVKGSLVALKDSLLPRHLKFGIIDRFDEGWFSNPEALGTSRQLEFGKLERLRPAIPKLDNQVRSIINKAPRVIFVGQRFGDYACSAETMLCILELMGCTEVLYKAHPKEVAAKLDEALAAASSRCQSVHIHRISELDAIPVESLLATGHFTHVIGLTSTSFIYMPKACRTIRKTSIAAPYLELYPLLYEERFARKMPPGHLRLLERDAQVFAAIAHDVEMPGMASHADPTKACEECKSDSLRNQKDLSCQTT